ncbi:phenylalanine--tRNA ligase, mitochondrial isoform X1 [Patella vulgata]|uniref:phenylalanine--tRNA ligase, mitochondrial isoform X1 n=2 Tax=Patella vulgata TaxID=6465 RepID=UPI00217F7BA8|nr:phenylalanine--tRNA ligase, mitochondrial isoform X1 [Patella vulgata]
MILRKITFVLNEVKHLPTWCVYRQLSVKGKGASQFGDTIKVFHRNYPTDMFTNVTPSILSKLGENLHKKQCNPLNLIRQRIEDFFYKHYVTRVGNPIFSIYDNMSPVVSLEQNFDSLLVPKDHVSRSLSDSYYINMEYMLRAHTSAHQSDLIKSGLDAFLVIGDVYRRDAIDSTHYPVFHQAEGVRLFNQFQLFSEVRDPTDLKLFENGVKTDDKQAELTFDATKLLEFSLKKTLQDLTVFLFGQDLEMKWVEAYFPFTHPSWELEIKYQGQWMEMLGCGIMEQRILKDAGAGDKVGWAFGLGLERLAMKLYSIPDIRLFWSNDIGFTSQFDVDNAATPITYKPVSNFPHCINDISFWVPEGFQSNDFYDLVRTVGGDLIEQVNHTDDFIHPKTNRRSHCYRIMYRHMEKTLTQAEVNDLHNKISEMAKSDLGVEIR